MKNQDILNELLKNQREEVDNSNRLSFYDLRRIAKGINSSIFSDKCVIWNGYFRKKKQYSSFFFRGKKRALHRLLYINFVESLGENQYLEFTCKSKGKCCNIKHMKKISYSNYPKRTIRYKIKTEPKIKYENLVLSFD